MTTQNYQVMIEQDENCMYVWEIVWLPACYAQAKSVPELLERLMEVAWWSIELLSDIAKNPDNKKFRFFMNLQYA